MIGKIDPSAGAPDAEKITHSGDYYIIDNCADKDEMMEKVEAAFYSGIRKLDGEATETKVRASGLEFIHEHFPIEKVLLLEKHIEKTLRNDLYHWSYRVGAENLNLPHPFYVDHLIVIRIHYPHHIARKAKTVMQPSRDVSDVLSHAISAIREPRAIVNQISRAVRRPRKKSNFKPESFHGDLIKPAQSHGAHIDTWYGHSYDGINLWWAIRGVNDLNSVLLYPDMIGRPVEYDEHSMYLKEGTQVSEPRTIDLAPGELLLFNPETLHSTHVNLSDVTRLALTTRINPNRPRFNDEAPFNFEHWHLSENLERHSYHALKVFPASKNVGGATINARPKYEHPANRSITIPGPLDFENGTTVCAVDDVLAGHRLNVDFDNAKLMIWKSTEGGLKAYSRMCPHMGVDLADGWHDDKAVHCPGHGMKLGWADGKSACESMRLAVFEVENCDGKIVVKRRAKAALEP